MKGNSLRRFEHRSKKVMKEALNYGLPLTFESFKERVDKLHDGWYLDTQKACIIANPSVHRPTPHMN